VDSRTTKRYGTFSYLPPLSRAQVRRQLQHIVAAGWIPAVEHTAPSPARTAYWSMWKLPLFGVLDADVVLGELDACHDANPGHLVRVLGYDPIRQTQGLAFVTHREPAT
jgi:ribulose-bisphosphate carboxylase small chain